MGYIPKEDVIQNFRKIGSVFEGHITRHVDGIWYGTGPLGVGTSVASAFALAEKKKGTDEKVFMLMGDGEAQEGQVHEMIHFARKYSLNNLIAFVDYNKVQLTASLEETMPIDINKIFEAGHWHVIEVNGHDYQDIWKALSEAHTIKDKPVVLVGHTVMGQGVSFMEETGKQNSSAWHGKAPKPDHEGLEKELEKLQPTPREINDLKDFRNNFIQWTPEHAQFPQKLSRVQINKGTPRTYSPDELTDCRSAYGNALLDLAKENPEILALTADLKGSVKTDGVSKELPDQYIECGIAEQHMVSAAGALSLSNYIPFCSTFGAFMTSRAKDQARVNDINYTNVKMVATHCGLSVGEDGPTHQAIDDMGSFLGLFNTHIIEPADPNQTDHIIRYIASHFGNFYVRMGRHKFPVITKDDGTPFYDSNYQYTYGRTDVIRKGTDITIAASGATINEALKARQELEKEDISAEIVAVSSIKAFDQTLIDSINKTGNVLTVEDHNPRSGLSGQLAGYLTILGIAPKTFKSLAVHEYQLSGTAEQLYHAAHIDADAIKKTCKKL